MNRVIQTKDLIYTNGCVVIRCPGNKCVQIGSIDNMPIRLPISLIVQWDEIAEIVFQEFIDARR